MEFIDNTGHIFSIKEWQSYPIGYEYEIGDYIFWIDSSVSSHKLSIGNYYIRPIRFVAASDRFEVSLKESAHFRLLSANSIQEKMERNKGFFDEISISEDMFVSSLNSDDLCIIDGIKANNTENTYTIATFYIVGYSTEEGTWMTDVMISNKDEEIYCPITVGGEFYDETSELIVNAQNMGVRLPKDILNAFYDIDVMSANTDEAYFTRKIKELMLSYMHIKGECGNYESAVDSLDWFGYGRLIEISQLLETDNRFVSQFVHDKFELKSDNQWTWQSFRRSSSYAIWMNINRYTDKEEQYRWDMDFVGEGKPFTEDLFNKTVYEIYDEKDIKFWHPYYKWAIQDMYMKMSMVEYYWKKYFLPIAFTVSSASLKEHCWVNDIKYIAKTSASTAEAPLWIGNDDTTVEFGDKKIYLYNQEVYFDDQFNEYSNSEWIGANTEEQILYINDVCARIPICFSTKSGNDENVYNVMMVLTIDGKKIHSSSFSFIQSKEKDIYYKNFVFIPKSLSKKYKYSYWVGKKLRLSVLCNGNWHYFDFELVIPEFQLKLGSLEYQYAKYGDKSLFSQIASISDDTVEFNSFMHEPKMVETNDINFFDKLKTVVDNARSSQDDMISDMPVTSSVNEYCKYLASKCYIYGIGLETAKSIYKKGDSIVPMFRFNNGVKLGNIESDSRYKLKSFDIDVLFDVDADNSYYAKTSFALNEIDKDEPIRCDRLSSYHDISDDDLVKLKKDIGCPDPSYNKDGSIDWENTSIEFRRFYIDEHIRHKENIVIRFVVSNGEIELPNGRIYRFGGYKENGNPRIFDDILLKIHTSDDECTMECDCPWQSECKFRFTNDETREYDVEKKDDPAEDLEDDIMSDVVKSELDRLISSYTETISIKKNKRFLNRIHIYDLYLTKMEIQKAKDLGLNISKVKKLEYNASIYDATWKSKDFWRQSPYITELYRMFFYDNGDCKLKVLDETKIGYDFYLMHDNSNWFAVFISQDTESEIYDDNMLEMPNEFQHITDDGDVFSFERYRSSDEFLVNRMMFIEKQDANHFNKEDLIVATIDNVRFPFIMDKASKWSVKSLNLENRDNTTLTSNANTMILSLYDSKDTKNLAGYYDIDVRYSIDGLTNQQQKKHRRILIK